MFCNQCGAQVGDQSMFCSNCGAKIYHNMPGNQENANRQVQPQSQVQPQQVVYTTQPQPQQVVYTTQPQPGQIVYTTQPQPQQVVYTTQPQPQQVIYTTQPQMQPQPQVQPQMQPQPQVQPQMQAQPQVQPQIQPQPQVQPQMQPQPQVQPQMQPQPQVQEQPQPQAQTTVQEPAAKKKSKAGLFIALAAVFVALIVITTVVVISSGVLKSPKKVFAESVVDISKNINGEIPQVGMTPLDALLHLGVDDTKDSHTTIATTRIESETMDESYEIDQSYSYNAENGDTAYTFSFSAQDAELGTGGLYFEGNEFVFVPMNASSPKVRYELDNDMVKSYKGYGAIDRYGLMLTGNEAQKTDWNEALEDFTENAIDGIDKKEFKKSTGKYTILGAEKTCKTVSVSANNDQALKLLNGLDDLIYRGMGSEDEENGSGVFKKVTDRYEQEGGTMDVNMETYKYKKSPVAIILTVNLNGDDYYYDISFYEKKKEKQLIFDNVAPDGKKTTYEEIVMSTGVGKYKMISKCDFGDSFVNIEEEGHILSNTKEVNGAFEIIRGDDANLGSASDKVGNTIKGSISEMMLVGNGTKTTTIENDKGSVTVVTDVSRGPLKTEKLTPPDFVSGTDTDCGDSLEMLTEKLGVSDSRTNKQTTSSLVHLIQVYTLMYKKGGISF